MTLEEHVVELKGYGFNMEDIKEVLELKGLKPKISVVGSIFFEDSNILIAVEEDTFIITLADNIHRDLGYLSEKTLKDLTDLIEKYK